MSGQGEIIFLPSQQQQPQFTQQPQQTFVQQPVRLGQSNGQRSGTTIVGQQRTPSSVSRGTIICLAIIIVLVVVGAIVLAFFLQGITNADKSGCTEPHYDNYKKGFGIDDGSCFFNQRKKDKTIKTCPVTSSFYYDVGGVDANYTPLEWANVVVNATTSFIKNSKVVGDELCFTINTFDVDGGALCAAASLEISGTNNDGVYCNTNVPPVGTLICADTVGKIDFTWYSDGKTNATGWEVEFVCGTFGCTIPQATNFNPEASIDDGSCIIVPIDVMSKVIEVPCDSNSFLFYDSGGPTGNYKNNELSVTNFKAKDDDKFLRFTYQQFDIDGFNSDCVASGLIIQYFDENFGDSVRKCNANNAPSINQISNQIRGKISRFIFYSGNNSLSIGTGWKIKIECMT